MQRKISQSTNIYDIKYKTLSNITATISASIMLELTCIFSSFLNDKSCSK